MKSSTKAGLDQLPSCRAEGVTMSSLSNTQSSGKRALVHIGTSKTGTTAIQESLALAAKEGKLAGISFPMLPGYKQEVVTNHNFFRVLYRPLSELTRMFTYPTSTPEADRDRDVSAFRVALAEAVAQNDRFVFSGEFISTFTPDEIEAFRRELTGLGITEITPLIYVRDPVSRYLSSVQQRLKASSAVRHPARYQDTALGFLQNWREAFPSLIVRPFDRSQLHEGDVVADFLRVMSDHFGVDLSGTGIELVSSNESISAEGMLILQKYRREFHPKRNNVFQKDSSELVRQLMRSEKAVLQTRPKLSLWVRQTIAARHAEYLEELRTVYGIEYGAVIETEEVVEGGEGASSAQIPLADIFEDCSTEVVDELTMWLLHRNLKEVVSQREEIAKLRKKVAEVGKGARVMQSLRRWARRLPCRRLIGRVRAPYSGPH